MSRSRSLYRREEGRASELVGGLGRGAIKLTETLATPSRARARALPSALLLHSSHPRTRRAAAERARCGLLLLPRRGALLIFFTPQIVSSVLRENGRSPIDYSSRRRAAPSNFTGRAFD